MVQDPYEYAWMIGKLRVSIESCTWEAGRCRPLTCLVGTAARPETGFGTGLGLALGLGSASKHCGATRGVSIVCSAA